MPEGKKMTLLHGIKLEDFEATVRRTLRPGFEGRKEIQEETVGVEHQYSQ